jgi:hypothetical protein
MKKYELLIITGNHLNPITQFAEGFEVEDGFYEFIYNDETIACYPISRTIIRSIEEMEEEE